MPLAPRATRDGGRVTRGHVHGEQSRCDCWLAPKRASIGERDAAGQEISRGDCRRIRGAARANDTLDSCVRRNDGGGRSRNQPGGLLQDPWCGPGQRHPGFLRSQECMPLAPRATRGRQGDGMPAPGFDQGTEEVTRGITPAPHTVLRILPDTVRVAGTCRPDGGRRMRCQCVQPPARICGL